MRTPAKMNNVQFDQPTYKKLTDKEIVVAQMAKEGKNCKDTAEILGIATSTVGNFRSRILRKVGVKNMTAAVVSLIERGIL